ncbi:MAG TPA: serine protease, partial [Thermopetrobacter sp.]|nr:serine protease [Thermopetrobacter sp.]
MDLALEGLDRAIADRDLDEEHVSALEAIVLPRYRPVVDVLNDSFHQPPSPWTHLGSGEYRQRIEAAVPSIGRVEVPGHPSIPYGGTAFVVGPNLLMTNRHVAEIFTAGLGRRDLVFRPGLGAAVDFKQEVYPSPPVLVEVRRVSMIHPYWDCALLLVDGLPAGRGHLALEGREPEGWRSREVAVIGYPAQDPRNDIQLQNRIFRGIYQRKRLQPGKLTGEAVIRSFGNGVEAITHDSSTLGGNSGSAVIDLTTGRVIGLHFAGIYLRANYAVPTWELARDARVADAGVVFHDAPARGTAPWDGEWLRADSNGKSAVAAAAGGGDRREAAGEKAAADWFERTSDAQLLDLLEREPERSRARLTAVLGDEEAAELIDDLALETGSGREAFGYPKPDPDVPEIVFLHGIMGSHLANRWG